jgi:hypothetical protein
MTQLQANQSCSLTPRELPSFYPDQYRSLLFLGIQ